MAAANSNPKSTLPNQTLFVGNLTDKFKNKGLRLRLVRSALTISFCAVVKLQLYSLFSQFGPVVEINAPRKGEKNHGFAFIVFRDVTAASLAMTRLQNFAFFGKDLVFFCLPFLLLLLGCVTENLLCQTKITRGCERRRHIHRVGSEEKADRIR